MSWPASRGAVAPLGRTLFVGNLDETVTLAGESYPLGRNRWASGAVTGGGHRFLERFALDGRVPAWTYAPGDALLERRIYMAAERNTTYFQYTLRRGSASGRSPSSRAKALVA